MKCPPSGPAHPRSTGWTALAATRPSASLLFGPNDAWAAHPVQVTRRGPCGIAPGSCACLHQQPAFRAGKTACPFQTLRVVARPQRRCPLLWAWLFPALDAGGDAFSRTVAQLRRRPTRPAKRARGRGTLEETECSVVRNSSATRQAGSWRTRIIMCSRELPERLNRPSSALNAPNGHSEPVLSRPAGLAPSPCMCPLPGNYVRA